MNAVARIRGPAVRLVALSSLMLFVELGLIRWLGAYNVYLSFFTNFILLASFLGIGVGFLRAGATRSSFPLAPVLLATVVIFLAVFPVEGARVGGELRVVGGFGWPALPKWISLSLLFVGSFLVMTSIAEGVARTFARFEPLRAYRLDIGGSLLGIGSFAALSFLGAGPIVWGLVVAVALAALTDRRRWFDVVALAVFVGVLAVLTFTPRTSWSPYQRITLAEAALDGSVDISVNGRPHQRIMPLTTMEAEQTFRFRPYERAPSNPLGNVLVIGAGSGNDVAIALSRGADHVDAVEIDPVLQRLGEDLHPDRPYDDPRVDAHVQDARAFLHDTDARYDLVLFAIPDSLTALAGQSALRLENYLFTEEAIREVRDHLTDDGVIAMYHYYLPTVADRYADTLDRVFGSPPCIDVTPGAGPRPRVVLIAGMDPEALECEGIWERPASVPPADTDDYPFPYLATRGIPGFYVVALVAILLASAVAVRAAGAPFGQMRPYLDLFCMGAAFLLLETTNVVRFALLFGTTWFVNALVFAGILASVFVAIEVAQRRPARRPQLLYVPLFASIVAAWLVPMDALLGLAFWPRFLAAVALGFTPVFFGNLIFADRFRDVAASTVAFGTNLLGAIAGGIVEYGALITGYRALLIAVAALYAAALVLGRSHLGVARTGAAGPGAVGADPVGSA